MSKKKTVKEQQAEIIANVKSVLDNDAVCEMEANLLSTILNQGTKITPIELEVSKPVIHQVAFMSYELEVLAAQLDELAGDPDADADKRKLIFDLYNKMFAQYSKGMSLLIHIKPAKEKPKTAKEKELELKEKQSKERSELVQFLTSGGGDSDDDQTK